VYKVPSVQLIDSLTGNVEVVLMLALVAGGRGHVTDVGARIHADVDLGDGEPVVTVDLVLVGVRMITVDVAVAGEDDEWIVRRGPGV